MTNKKKESIDSIISVRLSPEEKKKVKLIAAITDKSASEIIGIAVRKYLKKYSKELAALKMFTEDISDEKNSEETLQEGEE